MPLRLIMLCLLLVFILWVAWQPWRTAGGWHKSRVIVLLILVAIFVQQGWMEYKWQKQERVMADAITLISGEGSSVHCQRMNEAFFYANANLGHVRYDANGIPEKTTMMTWETCRDFRDWWDSDKTNPTDKQIIALHILTHEAVHMSGETNEATTECYSLQLMPDVAEEFGVTPAEADAMNSWYIKNVYPSLYAPYRSTDCVEGGRLDLSPRDGVWPRTNLNDYQALRAPAPA
jgi:hypothetical protein